MNFHDIALLRLKNQYLLEPARSPQQVVKTLGVVQSQEFPAARWALGMRSNATDSTITALFNQGKILRTHILRPTWHFVLPEDIYSMQWLTSPRVQTLNKYYYAKVDLDEATLKKAADALATELQGGHQLIRTEVRKVYEKAGINADGVRLGHLLMYAELEGVICSGAMQGKQHTYALLAEHAPMPQNFDADEALQTLTHRFFTSHGPATVHDFAWWASLRVSDVRRGIELAGLKSVQIEDASFFYAGNTEVPQLQGSHVQLLPDYDEFTVAYKERRPFMQAMLTRPITNDDFFYHIMAVNGQLVGGWRWKRTEKQVDITTDWLKKPAKDDELALQQAVDQLQYFVAH